MIFFADDGHHKFQLQLYECKCIPVSFYTSSTTQLMSIEQLIQSVFAFKVGRSSFSWKFICSFSSFNSSVVVANESVPLFFRKSELVSYSIFIGAQRTVSVKRSLAHPSRHPVEIHCYDFPSCCCQQLGIYSFYFYEL